MAYEDYTTYTDVDTENDFTITANKIEVDTIRRGVASWIVKDKGAGHFTDFEHLLKCTWIADSSDKSECGIWGLTNANFTQEEMETNSEGILLRQFYKTTGLLHQIRLTDMSLLNSDIFDSVLGTPYYYEIERIDTTLTTRIYDDSNRTNLVDTLVIVCENGAKRYILACFSRADTVSFPNVTQTLDIENLDLQEATPTATDKNIPNYFKSQFITHH